MAENERPNTPKTPKTPTPGGQKEKEPFDADEVRETQLRRELEGVRNINEVIEGVIGTLERAKGHMGNVSQTVDNASTLLNTWTRILSQTEHNQRLILNPNWKGSTQDIEAEAAARQQALERKAAEEERRREEARRKAEEQDRARLAGTSSAAGRGSGTRGVRGVRGLRGSRSGILRGGTGAGSGMGGYGGASSSTRGGSQIGRGFGASRTTRGTRGTGTRGTGTGSSRGVR
ncbi:putative dash complex subunit duo1 [Diaporthe ampelina]|uniref:DASH complex subunit DUO1 n=1 Tax=Diaporthe ampelina TaxID=1214573 RepID=A0A0G2FKL8_9PEZI|nr:putative dash complex subunit duo1 [Diaporthe ampelina]